VLPGFRSAWVDQSAYPGLAPGASGTVTLRYRNAGSEPWEVGVAGRQVNLGVSGDSLAFADLGMAARWLSPNRLATAAETFVAPGEIGTFSFSVRAPTAPGSYRIDLRLVADGVTWLDDQGAYVIVTSDYGYHSTWVSQSPWPTVRAGATTTPIILTFRNTGTQPWTRGVEGQQANLGIVDDDLSWASYAIAWPGGNRPAIQNEASVAPGETASFAFGLRAPAAPGEYVLRLRPVIDGLTWLEDQGVYILVNVVP
jgi:hypothetical protein